MENNTYTLKNCSFNKINALGLIKNNRINL